MLPLQQLHPFQPIASLELLSLADKQLFFHLSFPYPLPEPHSVLSHNT